MVPAFKQEFYRNIHIECLEEYIRLNPDNVDALLDLAQLYDGSGKFDKELSTLNKAVEKDPKNILAWHALALFHERMMDFDSAIRAFERETSIDKDSDVSYNNLAQAWLAKDVNKAAEAIQKATDLKNSSSNRKDAKAILDYQKAVKNGKPYEGCLQLIESGTIYDDNIKKAAIEKLLKEYPGVKNSARNKLEVIKSRLDSGK